MAVPFIRQVGVKIARSKTLFTTLLNSENLGGVAEITLFKVVVSFVLL